MGTLRVGHSSRGAGFAPIFMAMEASCFAERGVEVVPVELPSTGAALQKVAASELDVTGTSGVAILYAALSGVEPVVVMSLEAENVFSIIGSSQVRSPEDLRGSVVAANGKQDQDHLILCRALREWGIDPETDVTVELLGSRGANWQALLEGRVQAMASTIPLPFQAAKMGLPILRDFSTEGSPYQLGCFVTTRGFADAEPEVLRAFLAGLLEGYRLFQSDFDAALPHMMARSRLDDVDVLRRTHAVFTHAMDHYVPTEEALAAVLRDLSAARSEAVTVDVSRIVDPSFLPRDAARR